MPSGDACLLDSNILLRIKELWALLRLGPLD
jgi:hypothetical protein